MSGLNSLFTFIVSPYLLSQLHSTVPQLLRVSPKNQAPGLGMGLSQVKCPLSPSLADTDSLTASNFSSNVKSLLVFPEK